ncbi:aminoglycoside 6'-N-acetyltransferase [Brevibacterium iodinum ATCC 49514]|uniref:Aminoglycoside 6'-N-acetyltransferase n=1 Tax=Brevibacterium iodinum ATCC 49514 TaxID=1255616 RepID=A0A2H1KAV7_9MICO|nr:GNAT family N-acetyltransferase [Brevibacterium iodinum]SMX96674.1 aminoglycoside 6'-N-acetyltransferase [Brevibacterium iodinum ATCC 49514]SUW14001.1 spermidine N1-acetyltransferase [Brevibacterium iodinum]
MDPVDLPLTTDRLRLRPYVESDAEAQLRILSREDVSRFLLQDSWTAEVAETQIAKRIPRTGLETESRALALVIETADGLDSLEGSRVIGDIALWLEDGSEEKAEIGWILDPAAGGHGFATEAAIAVLNVAFDHYGLHRVFAQMDARNTASAKLAQRIGMRQEAHLRKDWWSKGEWTDTLIFGMLASDRQTA